MRKFSSIVSKHSEFLNLVKHQGEGDILFSVQKNVGLITISNARKRNAISGKMMLQFANIVDHIKSLDSLCGLILTAKGKKVFSAGADFALVKNVVNTPERGVLMSYFMTESLNSLRQSGFISVCVLNGSALGGGAELSTTCDFRLMPNSEKCYIQFVHAKIGASPGWGGARRLTSIVGRKEAIRLACGSIPCNSENAKRIGLVDELMDLSALSAADEDQLVDALVARGKDFLQPYLSQQYVGSVRAIKKTIASVEDMTPSDSKRIELDSFRERWYSADNIEALSKK